MKTISLKSFALLALGATVMFSCKKKSPESVAPKGEVEIVVQCSGPDYESTETQFRANAIGESIDQSAARKKSLENARAELASLINSTVKSVTDNYLNSREFNNKEEVEERFEQLSRTVVNQEIAGLKKICEKTFKTAEGKYKTYMAVELGSNELLQSLNDRLSADEKLKIDYDYEKFKGTFNEEMNNFK